MIQDVYSQQNRKFMSENIKEGLLVVIAILVVVLTIAGVVIYVHATDLDLQRRKINAEEHCLTLAEKSDHISFFSCSNY